MGYILAAWAATSLRIRLRIAPSRSGPRATHRTSVKAKPVIDGTHRAGERVGIEDLSGPYQSQPQTVTVRTNAEPVELFSPTDTNATGQAHAFRPDPIRQAKNHRSALVPA